MKDATSARFEILRVITPVMVTIVGALTMYILSQQSALMANVNQHHEQDIDRRESMELFVTKAEIRECVQRLDGKLDMVVDQLKEMQKSK